MKHPRDLQVGIDSQCFSYLLDAIAGRNAPCDRLASEKVALVRSWLYRRGTFTLTKTVVDEIRNIRNVARREFHDGFIQALFLDPPVNNYEAVNDRSREFGLLHSGCADCLILAEAEDLGLDVVLTYDSNFYRRLHSASPTTRLLKPAEYWDSIGVSRGDPPVTTPHDTNPLSHQTWWRW